VVNKGRIVVNKGIQQEMGSIHGRLDLDLDWLPVPTRGKRLSKEMDRRR